MSKKTSIVDSLVYCLGADDFNIISACSVIYSGGLFLNTPDKETLINHLKPLMSNCSVICDLGFVGSHVIAALLALDESDSLFQYADSLLSDSQELEVFYEGVGEFLENSSYSSVQAESLMQILLKRVNKVSSNEQYLIAETIELATSELGVSALRLAKDLPLLMSSLSGTAKSTVKLAISNVASEWNIASIEKLKKYTKKT